MSRLQCTPSYWIWRGSGAMLIRQREREKSLRAGDGDVLLPADHVGHWRRAPGLVRLEVPEGLTVFGVERGERAAAVAEEDQAAGRGERSGGAAASHLLVIPNGTAGLDVESADVALAARLAAGGSVEEPVAVLEGLGHLLVHRASLGRQNIKELGDGTVGCRHPGSDASGAGADARPFD